MSLLVLCPTMINRVFMLLLKMEWLPLPTSQLLVLDVCLFDAFT
ncbi:TPA: DUF645 family protein [Vibrio cholerae]